MLIQRLIPARFKTQCQHPRSEQSSSKLNFNVFKLHEKNKIFNSHPVGVNDVY